MIRDELAEHIRNADGLEDYTVYSYPPEVAAIPAVVLTAQDPYQVPKTFGRDGPAQIGTMLLAAVLVQRATIEDGFTKLEDARAAISAALATFVGTDGGTARWESFGGIGTQKVAEMDVLSGALSLMVVQAGP